MQIGIKNLWKKSYETYILKNLPEFCVIFFFSHMLLLSTHLDEPENLICSGNKTWLWSSML